MKQRSQLDKEVGNPGQPAEEWDPVEEGRREQLAWQKDRERQRRPIKSPTAPTAQGASERERTSPSSGDPIVDVMHKAGIPITRESYISINWAEGKPDPWTAEDESELPPELQDWSQVKYE